MRRVLPIIVLIFSFVLASQAANPVPYVNQPLVPATVVPGGPGFTLVINGTGFVPTSVVKWNGSPRVTTFVNSSQLQAQILASDIANAGTGTVTVSCGGAASNQSFLFIASPRLKPTFTRHLVLEANTPQNAVVGDFNLDGKADIAGASGYSSTFISWPEVGVLLGMAREHSNR